MTKNTNFIIKKAGINTYYLNMQMRFVNEKEIKGAGWDNIISYEKNADALRALEIFKLNHDDLEDATVFNNYKLTEMVDKLLDEVQQFLVRTGSNESILVTRSDNNYELICSTPELFNDMQMDWEFHKKTLFFIDWTPYTLSLLSFRFMSINDVTIVAKVFQTNIIISR